MLRCYKLLILLVLLAFVSCNPYPSESQRIKAAFEQAQLVYGDGENDTLLFIPELDKASAYYARKKDFGKAALSALYQGYAEKDYDKTLAMDAFKEAEHWAELIGDSLTMARAEYQMGRLLYYDYMFEEALVLDAKSEAMLGHNYSEKVLALNGSACCYIMLEVYDKADSCLDRALHYAELEGTNESKQKVYNNYAVLYLKQGNYSKAIGYLKKVSPKNNQQNVLNLLNFGNLYLRTGDLDSAAYYLKSVEDFLQFEDIKDETKVAAHSLLSKLAENQGNYQKALEYSKNKERFQGRVRDRIEKRNIYYIQKKYNYEELQRKTEKMVFQKRKIIMVLCILLAIILGITLVLYYRYIQKRIHEMELNNILLQFMEQNEVLLKQGIEQNKERSEMIRQLTELQMEKIKAMQKFDVFFKDRKNITALTDLEKQLFSNKNHWNVMLEVINNVYPGLYDQIKEKYPAMDELERKVCLLSRFKLSRTDEASLLGVSISVLDKIRGRVRREMEQKGFL